MDLKDKHTYSKMVTKKSKIINISSVRKPQK